VAAGLTPTPAARGHVAMRVVVALALFAVLVLSGCATRPRGPTYPPEGVTPPPAGPSTDAAKAAVVAAVANAGLQAVEAQQAFRPPEGAWFASAPRTLVQVSVPNEATPRFIVIYAFGSAADAATAAADEAAYVSHGAGRVMFPNDSHFTIRVLGSTAIFFTWSPGSADGRTQSIEDALDTVGTGVAIPA